MNNIQEFESNSEKGIMFSCKMLTETKKYVIL